MAGSSADRIRTTAALGDLCLTEKARPILARILELSTAVRNEAFAELSEEEGRHLVDLLRRVHGNLAERVPTPSAPPLPTGNAPSHRSIRRRLTVEPDLAPAGGHQ